MSELLSPILGNYIYIGGGTLVLIIVIILLLMGRL